MNYYNENDRKKAEWLRQLIAAGVIWKGYVDERSIKEVSPADLRGFTQCHFFAGIGIWIFALRLAGWPSTRPVWSGSCPCQPFSVAGEGKGTEDERHLWPAWFQLICQCRPRVVFGEQTADGDGITWLDTVHSQMESIQYRIGALVLPASGFGAPHARHRSYFVADTELRTAERPGLELGTAPAGESREGNQRQRLRVDPGNGRHAGELGDSGRSPGCSELGTESREGPRGRAPEIDSWWAGQPSEVGELADSAVERSGSVAGGSVGEALAYIRRCYTDERMADPRGIEWQRREFDEEGCEPDGSDAGRDESACESSGSGAVLELADSKEPGRPISEHAGSVGEETGGRPRLRGTPGHSETCELADHNEGGRGIDGNQAGNGDTPGIADAQQRDETQRMADSEIERGHGLVRTRDGSAGSSVDGSSNSLDDAQRTRLEGHTGNGNESDESRRVGERPERSATAAGPTNGFWGDAEWVPTRGKVPGTVEWRPIKPESQPLDDGVAADLLRLCDYGFPLVAKTEARTMRLKGYGDGIVAQVAIEFIKAYASL